MKLNVVDTLVNLLTENGLLFGFVFVAALAMLASFLSRRTLKQKLQWSAIAMLVSLFLALIGGMITGGTKGLADIAGFAGLSFFGGAMFRDFTIVSLVAGIDLQLFKKYAGLCLLSLAVGLLISFFPTAVVTYLFGYRDAVSITTIAAGGQTFVVGPVTGAALGASSEVIAISIAVGLVKSVGIIVFAPLFAKLIRLTTPKAAVIFGGLMGTKSGTIAGLAATNESLVPYGVLSSAFFTGFGCLLCPSLFYWVVQLFC